MPQWSTRSSETAGTQLEETVKQKNGELPHVFYPEMI